MSRAKKQFGQHFLSEHAYIDRIIAALHPRPDDRILEIGPGRGALTLPLLKQISPLIAIELDTDLIPNLQYQARMLGELQIIQKDVLQVALDTLATDKQLRVVGNLPYYISSPILFHCLQYAHAIKDMHFMLQKEVVERMAAQPGSKAYGRLSVMLQLECHVIPLFDVPASAFSPPPKVTSAVVRLVPLSAAEKDLPVNKACLDTIVKAAFSKRRKTLANALKGIMDASLLLEEGIDPKARAENLSPKDYIKLARRYGEVDGKQTKIE